MADIDIKDGEVLEVTKAFNINFEFDLKSDFEEFNYSLNIFSVTGEHIFNTQSLSFKACKRHLKASCVIPANLMNNGDYTISVMVVSMGSISIYYFENVLRFEIFDNREHEKWFGQIGGAVRPKLDWTVS